jgi:hypothetical protein
MKKILAAMWLAAAGSLAAGLYVDTNPNAYRGDDAVSFERGQLGQLVFYIFNDDGRTPLSEPVLTVTLPDSVKLLKYGILNDQPGFISPNRLYSEFEATKANGFTTYVLKGEDQAQLKTYAPGKWTIYCNYHIYLYLDVTGGAPAQFPVKWEIRSQGGSAQGELKAQAVTAPAARRPASFQVWTDPGFDNRIYDRDILERVGKLYRHSGVTHVINSHFPYTTKGGSLTPAQAEILHGGGLGLIDRYLIPGLFETEPGVLNLPENEALLTFRNIRSRTRADRFKVNSLQLCPSALVAGGGSKLLRQYASDMAKKAKEQKYTAFFCDYEKDIYDNCYCADCRKSFAGYAGQDPELIAGLDALELMRRYPLELYRFRSYQTGLMYDALRKLVKAEAPEAQVGINSALWNVKENTPGLGNGFVYFAEDPRFLDFGVDFHNTDTIKGGLEDVVRNGLYASFDFKKPVIARAGGFCDINWHYFCVLSRKGWARQNNEPFAAIIRPRQLKLSVANVAAAGIQGVEVQVAPDVSDAACRTGLREALDFIAEFEPFFNSGHRAAPGAAAAYGDRQVSAEYRKLGETSHFAKYYFYGPVAEYGAVQPVFREKGGERLAALFNWDVFGARPVRVAFPGLSEPRYQVVLYLDGKKQRVDGPEGAVWSAGALANGVSVVLPPAAVAGVTVAPYADGGGTLPVLAYQKPDPSLQLLEPDSWRNAKKPSSKAFMEHIFNHCIKRLGEKYPEILKIQYQPFPVTLSSWLVPVDKNKKLLPPEWETVMEPVKESAPALRLRYHHSLAENSREDTVLTVRKELPGTPVKLTAWLHGDNSGAGLQLSLNDRNGETHQYYKTAGGTDKVNWTGWKAVEWDIAAPSRSFGGGDAGRGTVDYPLSNPAFVLNTRGGGARSYVLVISDLKSGDAAGTAAVIIP